jgi:hypothetical protein
MILYPAIAKRMKVFHFLISIVTCTRKNSSCLFLFYEEVEEVVIRKPKPKAKPEPTYHELIYESAKDRIKTKIS